MDYENILEKLRAFKKGNAYTSSYQKYFSHFDVDNFDGLVSDPWLIGGLAGGSCWGSEPDRPLTPEDGRNFNALDELIKEVIPELTYLQYKELESKIQAIEFTVNEYYGNYSIYEFNYISYKDIAEVFMSFENDPTVKKTKKNKM